MKDWPPEPGKRKGKLSYIGLLSLVPAVYFAISTRWHQLHGTHEIGMRTGEIGYGRGYFFAIVYTVMALVVLFTRDRQKPE